MAYQIISIMSGLSGVDVAYLLSCQPSVSPSFPTVLSRDPSAHRYWGVSNAFGYLPMQEEATSTAGDESYYARYHNYGTGSCTFIFSFDGEHTYTLYSPWDSSRDPYPWGGAGSSRYGPTSMTFSHLPSFYNGDREGIGFLTAKNTTYNDRYFTSVTFHEGATLSLSTEAQPRGGSYHPYTFVIPVYQAIHRTITLSSNGAPVPDDSLIVYADDFPGFDNPIRGVTHSPPPLPTPTSPSGFIFDGWYTASSGGTKVESITSFPSQDITYYAHWIEEEVVILDPNGGQLPSNSNYFIRVYYGQTYGTLPNPTRDGYTFAGWFTAATGGTLVTAQTIVTNPSDHTLYAHWTPISIQHTLYFDANGGMASESSRQVYSGSAYGSLPTTTWNYHTFVGWFTDPYSGTQVDANTIMGEDDTIIYAHWTDDTTTVTFNGNGGEPSTQTITYPSGSKYGSLPSATRSGFILAGWFTAGGTRVEPSDTVSAQALYAQWKTSGGTAEGVIWNKNTDFVIEMPAQ